MKPGAQDANAGGRHALMSGMVEKLLLQIDPDGHRELLLGLKAEYQPSTPQATILVERFADIAWRLRGCPMMETELLSQGIRQRDGEETSTALAEAFMDGFKGPRLLAKLASYEDYLQRQFSKCLYELARLKPVPVSDTRIELDKIEPCTSLIQ